MQSMEENRINKIKSMVKQVADIERSVIPIINTCIDGMVKASDGISAEEVLVIYIDILVPIDIVPFTDLFTCMLLLYFVRCRVQKKSFTANFSEINVMMEIVKNVVFFLKKKKKGN
jgi:hypothetical protein